MWSERWGEMIWGGVQVPLEGLLGRGVLIALLLGTGYLLMRRPQLRRYGWLGLVLLVAVPLVARGAYQLPHVFANGTIADADDVNENFAAITEDYSRFVAKVPTGPVGESVPIPVEVLDDLCGDGDGCSLRFYYEFSQSLSGGGTSLRMISNGTLLLGYTQTTGALGARAFSLSGGPFSVDGYEQYQMYGIGGCYLEDFQRIASVAQPDNTLGLWLVKLGAANESCTLVMDD